MKQAKPRLLGGAFAFSDAGRRPPRRSSPGDHPPASLNPNGTIDRAMDELSARPYRAVPIDGVEKLRRKADKNRRLGGSSFASTASLNHLANSSQTTGNPLLHTTT
jgi:hypothetical protein